MILFVAQALGVTQNYRIYADLPRAINRDLIKLSQIFLVTLYPAKMATTNIPHGLDTV